MKCQMVLYLQSNIPRSGNTYPGQEQNEKGKKTSYNDNKLLGKDFLEKTMED